MLPPTIQEIRTKDFTWLNVSQTSKGEMDYLAKTYNFHPAYLMDCLSPIQRPKIVSADKYLFMVLLLPLYRRKKREIISCEVDFFISENYLVTVHSNQLPSLINFFNLCQTSQSHQKKYFNSGPAALLYGLLSELLTSCNPILDDFSFNINNIEENIFRGYERRMVKEFLIVKRNIINFRRIIQIHETILSKFVEKGEQFFPLGPLKLHFLELIEMAGDIWDGLENLHQSITTLEQTNNSLISFQLNYIMKILMVISLTLLPVALIAGIFGMGVPGTPFIKNSSAFRTIIILMISTSSLVLLYFKRKKWL